LIFKLNFLSESQIKCRRAAQIDMSWQPNIIGHCSYIWSPASWAAQNSGSAMAAASRVEYLWWHASHALRSPSSRCLVSASSSGLLRTISMASSHASHISAVWSASSNRCWLAGDPWNQFLLAARLSCRCPSRCSGVIVIKLTSILKISCSLFP